MKTASRGKQKAKLVFKLPIVVLSSEIFLRLSKIIQMSGSSMFGNQIALVAPEFGIVAILGE
jgi:hypothetical protein